MQDVLVPNRETFRDVEGARPLQECRRVGWVHLYPVDADGAPENGASTGPPGILAEQVVDLHVPPLILLDLQADEFLIDLGRKLAIAEALQATFDGLRLRLARIGKELESGL